MTDGKDAVSRSRGKGGKHSRLQEPLDRPGLGIDPTWKCEIDV